MNQIPPFQVSHKVPNRSYVRTLNVKYFFLFTTSKLLCVFPLSVMKWITDSCWAADKGAWKPKSPQSSGDSPVWSLFKVKETKPASWQKMKRIKEVEWWQSLLLNKVQQEPFSVLKLLKNTTGCCQKCKRCQRNSRGVLKLLWYIYLKSKTKGSFFFFSSVHSQVFVAYTFVLLRKPCALCVSEGNYHWSANHFPSLNTTWVYLALDD